MNINPSNSFIVRWSLCFSLRNTPLKFQGRPGGVVVYQYTRKKFAKIPKNTQNQEPINDDGLLPKFIQIYPKLYQGILYT